MNTSNIAEISMTLFRWLINLLSLSSCDLRAGTLSAKVTKRDSGLDETNGFDPNRNSFTQYYGGKALDASLLLIPQVGFLPPDDPRVVGTIMAIEQELVRNGFVLRYSTDQVDDGIGGKEGAFLACSFWLADAYVMLGRTDDALKQS